MHAERMHLASPGWRKRRRGFDEQRLAAAANRHGACEVAVRGLPQTATQPTIVMSKLTSLEALLVQEIKDLYNAETQLVKALPKMAKAASDEALAEGFKAHLEETKEHVQRLEDVAKFLDASPKGKVCKAMKGLVEEGAEAIEEQGDPSLRDLALIIAAQKVEHYEIAGYGSARTIAGKLGFDDVVDLLQTTLDEEGETDKKLTELATRLLPVAQEVGAGS
jgi:ferritin-like metal-binding protein YciE